MKGSYQIYLFTATLLAAMAFFIQRGCQRESSLFTVENLPEVNWEVRSFDDALFSGDSMDWKNIQQSFQPFLQGNSQRFFWQNERENQLLKDHYTNVQNLLNKRVISEELAMIAARANALLELSIPSHLYFYISGIDLETPCLYYSGSTTEPSFAFVGLDNYLGAAYPGYGSIAGYQRELMRKEQLPVQFAHALVSTINPNNFNDETLLAQMIFYGKRHIATEALCPEISTAEILGYSPEAFAFLEDSERQVWEVFVREKLLFSTDMMIRQRLAEPAPFSKLGTAMDADVPGQVAQFIGYKMVRSFADNHPELSLNEILNIRDAQKFLREAQYKP